MRWLLPLLVFLPLSFVSSQGLNAGFVQGIWYSKSPFFAGETVRIYTAIQNNSGADIAGKVAFLVNGEEIGKASFSVVDGRIAEAWTDWKIAQGNHTVAAKITEAAKKEIGKDPEPITLDLLVAPADEVFADLDTDGDGTGNLEDEDDDNDGIPDAEELKLGTNPLNPDSDADGVAEGKEEKTGQEKQSPLSEFSKKLTDEYLGFGPQVDAFAEDLGEDLREQRNAFQERRGAAASGESRNPLSPVENAWDFLLASAITALPEWRFGLFLLFGTGLVLLLRRFS